jgi:hypothetical protein
MNAIKKTVLATAVLMSMGAGAAQAAVTNFDFVGSFVMFDGGDATFTNPSNVVDNGNGLAGDPVVGTMSIDDTTGAGTATMTGQPFFGSTWLATGITLQATGPGMVTANMLFHWGDPAATACGLTNCDIGVTVGFAMMPTANPMAFSVTTVSSDMPAGPFAGFQPTFNGVATVATPVPAAAWLLGSGLLGLVGVARRKAA